MIGIIPNPKKTFQIEKKLEDVQSAIEDIVLFDTKYTLLKTNPILNLLTFEATEFLSLGVFIDITCFTVNESRTEITIEIKRKVGTFNQSHEVTQANQHITKITDLISESISTDKDIRKEMFENIEIQKQNKIDADKQRIESIREKGRIEKLNNPILYYTKQSLIILFSIGLIIGVVYVVIKVLK